MHTNTAGVNTKWAELQGEASAFCFVWERKTKFRNNLQKWLNEKQENIKKKAKYECQCVVIADWFPPKSFLVPHEVIDLCCLHINGYFQT